MAPPAPLDTLSTFHLTFYKRVGEQPPSSEVVGRQRSLNGSERAVFAYLQEQGTPVRSSQICAATGFSRATVARGLGRLGEDGLVERVEGPGRSNVRYRVKGK